MTKKILFIHTDAILPEMAYARLIHKPSTFSLTFIPISKLLARKHLRQKPSAIIIDAAGNSAEEIISLRQKVILPSASDLPLILLIGINDYLVFKPMLPEATFIIKDSDSNYQHQLPFILDNLISEKALQLRLKYELFSKHRELLADTLFDELTECYNNHFIQHAIRSELARNHPFTLLRVSIQNARELIRGAGAMGFSELMRALANEIRSVMRQSDLLARTGDGELTVLMISTPKSKATALEFRLDRKVSNLMLRDEQRKRQFFPRLKKSVIDSSQPGHIHRFLNSIQPESIQSSGRSPKTAFSGCSGDLG